MLSHYCRHTTIRPPGHILSSSYYDSHMNTPTDYDAAPSSLRHLVHDLLTGNNNGTSEGGDDHYDEFCRGAGNLYDLAQHERITWDSVKLITIFSSVLWATCLLGYELFRRDPIVGKYVYDRKRLVQPDRSPPPLMLSRSLWRCREDDVTTTTTPPPPPRRTRDDDNNNVSSSSSANDNRSTDPSSSCCCCRVLPAILEIIFLALDMNYVRYSQLANSARLRREDDLSYYTCCRTGWYHVS